MSSSKKPSSLNKLSFDKPIWLASDIHLGPDNPATAEHFFQFLDQASAHAGALLLLGDIFDVWIGDDCTKAAAPWLRTALDRLSKTAKHCPLWMGRGNRDFLMGERLTQHLGAHLLDEQVVLNVQGQTLLVAHGDEFCTSDLKYQRFRRLVRNRLVQKLYLALSLSARQRIAQRARLQSMRSHANKSMQVMDVNPDAIVQAFSKTDVPALIHGHTHRPGHHHELIAGKPHDRWVLTDWAFDHLPEGSPVRGGGLMVDASGVHVIDWAGQKIK